MGAAAVVPPSPLAPAVGNRLSIGEEHDLGKARPLTPVSHREVAQCNVSERDDHPLGPCEVMSNPTR